MKRFSTACALLVFAMTLSFNSTAQTSDMPVSIGVMAGPNDYFGEINKHAVFDFDNPTNFVFGGEFGFFANKSFDFAINIQGGGIGDMQEDTGENFEGKYTSGNFLVKYKLANDWIMKESSKIKPYVHLGAGFTDWKNSSEFSGLTLEYEDLTSQANFGFGFLVPLNDKWNFELRDNFAYASTDAIDLIPEDMNDLWMTLTGGISYNLGSVTDSDGDGISDKKDACPNTKGLAQFAGCPDTDADGIQDSKDACPTVAGTAELGGCPDSDGDGIADNEDKCPNKAGDKAFMGCPDSDGDGIADSEDACPKVAGSAEMNGCPDSDGDGIADNMDKCPNEKGVAALKGCPDSDGDGIGDAQDKCPNEKGIASNNGCPGVSEEAKEVFAQALRGIKFESSKDVIKGESYAILNNVVKVMNDNPSYKLFIQGHTDSQGDDGFNMTLSEKRAAAVKNFLVGKGVNSSRMRTAGFGETVPVADNGTAAGRAQNRRVEFKVEF